MSKLSGRKADSFFIARWRKNRALFAHSIVFNNKLKTNYANDFDSIK